jgi:hypothetical protein
MEVFVCNLMSLFKEKYFFFISFLSFYFFLENLLQLKHYPKKKMFSIFDRLLKCFLYRSDFKFKVAAKFF